MIEPELKSKTRGYRRRQRFIVPLIMLTIALLFSFWSSHLKTARNEQLRVYYHDLCAEIILGLDPSSRIVADNDEKKRGFIETLREVLEPIRDAGLVRIEVESGDASPFADGRASHTAWIFLDDRPSLGIRIAVNGDETIQTIGYWIMTER